MERPIFRKTKDFGKSLVRSVKRDPEMVPAAAGLGTFTFINNEVGLLIMGASIVVNGTRTIINKQRNKERRDN